MTAPPAPFKFNPLRFCPPLEISDSERLRRISTAAYFKAAARNFAPGHEVEDWLAAEAEIDRVPGSHLPEQDPPRRLK